MPPSAIHQRFPSRPSRLSGRASWCACAAMLIAGSLDARAAERPVWEHSPYRVLATLAVDDHSRPQPDLPTALSGQIAARVEGSLRPLWDFKIDSPDAGPARRQCFELREIPWDELSADQKANDKLLWLGVRVLPHGYELAAREFDVHMRRWGPVQRRVVQQSSFLADASFELLRATFSPLAMVEPIEGKDEQVQLIFRGSQLPRPSGEESFVTLGEAYLPLLRRTDRSGKVIEGGILPVPWTYLTTTEANDAGWLASVHSGVRRPFGTGKKGLVEQIAVGLRLPPGATPVRFHARTDKSQGLAGYEVFRETPDGGSERVGVTDRNGMIVVPPNGAAVSMLMLRSDGQVLAKVPVVSGGSDVQQTPIADNVTRLQAQAEAQVVREELIDLVARRAIVMGRVKALLKKNRIDDAKELMSELDAMPSPSVFGRTIENAARRIPKSDDASVQKRIDSLFSSTRDMLTKFLNTRPVTELQDQVNEAAKTQPPAAAETTEAPADAAAPTS